MPSVALRNRSRGRGLLAARHLIAFEVKSEISQSFRFKASYSLATGNPFLEVNQLRWVMKSESKFV